MQRPQEQELAWHMVNSWRVKSAVNLSFRGHLSFSGQSYFLGYIIYGRKDFYFSNGENFPLISSIIN